MRTVLLLLLCLGLAGTAAVAPEAQAQGAEPEPEAERKQLLMLVRKAERLREFGRPLLARKQLDLAAAIDPQAREVLLGYLQLYTRSGGDLEEGAAYADTLATLWSGDYDACYEVALWLFQADQAPLPPDPEDPEPALQRLAAETAVFAELADYILNPEGDPPASAAGKPALSLAWLARAASRSPETADVLFLAAQELDFRGRNYQRYASVEIFHPFEDAAQKLYERTEKLYGKVKGSDQHRLLVRIALPDLLLRMGRIEEADRAATAGLLLSPDNLRLIRTRIEAATALQDIDRLVTALQARQRVVDDVDSALDLSVAGRIRDRKWPFSRWGEYRFVLRTEGNLRMQAAGELLEVEPEFLEIHYLAATELMYQASAARDPEGRVSLYEGALKALERAGEIEKTLADVPRLKALCLWQLGRFGDAETQFLAAAALDPEDAMAPVYAKAAGDIEAGRYTDVDFHVWMDLQRAGDFEEKFAGLREVVKRAPDFFEAQLALGEVAFFLRRFQDARKAYREAERLGPENLEALQGAAFSALMLALYDESKGYFEKVEEIRPGYGDSTRWLAIAADLAQASEDRRRAFQLWQDSTTPAHAEPYRIRLLEEAIRLDSTLPEPLVDLAALHRKNDPERARKLLEAALEHARDDFGKAAAHHELGRLFAANGSWGEAAKQFETAWTLSPGDGSDLLLAAIALHSTGDEAAASAAMARLFSEGKGTTMLRPSRDAAELLGARPASAAGPQATSPGWTTGQTLAFDFRLEIEGEGGGQDYHRVELAFGVSVEVLAEPSHGGLWKLRVTFSDPPSNEYAALSDLKLEMQISPWFGMLNDPIPAGNPLAEIAGPALQALTEALTIGLGDAAVSPPYLWCNRHTAGPPHFDKDSLEAAWIESTLGGTVAVVRKAVAGRKRADADPFTANVGRSLEARLEIGGARHAVRRVGFEIVKEELSPEEDDVISSRLSVELKAK